MGAREYDPRVGRWLQRDPIEVASGDPNLYRYCFNDALNFNDPSGTILPFLVAVGAGAAAGGLVGGIVSWATGGSFWEGAAKGAVIGAAGAAGGYLGGLAAGALGLSGTAGAIAGGALTGIGSDLAVQGMFLALGWQDCYHPWETLGAAFLGVGSGWWSYTGRELSFGRNLRVAPFGNRTGHPTGEYPHYHRRGPIDPQTGRPRDGQGIGRHRPWDKKKSDKSFWDRF